MRWPSQRTRGEGEAPGQLLERARRFIAHQRQQEHSENQSLCEGGCEASPAPDTCLLSEHEEERHPAPTIRPLTCSDENSSGRSQTFRNRPIFRLDIFQTLNLPDLNSALKMLSH